MKVLVVDDEQFCRDNLELLIQEYCPDVSEIKKGASAEEAREILKTFEPDVLFLDIKMPNESGFDLLKSISDRRFAVIFTTAHNEYALEALKAQAIDYLEKPINIDELAAAIEKTQLKSSQPQSLSELKELLQKANEQKDKGKIAIPTRDGFEIIPYDDIVHLEASESYTTLFLNGGKRLMSSKNIKVYEDKLDPQIFFRTHKSHIINIGHHIKGFSRVEGNSAVMSNGKQIPIARRKLQSFLDRIAEL